MRHHIARHGPQASYRGQSTGKQEGGFPFKLSCFASPRRQRGIARLAGAPGTNSARWLTTVTCRGFCLSNRATTRQPAGLRCKTSQAAAIPRDLLDRRAFTQRAVATCQQSRRQQGVRQHRGQRQQGNSALLAMKRHSNKNPFRTCRTEAGIPGIIRLRLACDNCNCQIMRRAELAVLAAGLLTPRL